MSLYFLFSLLILISVIKLRDLCRRRIAENCKLNSMDSKNLAICWWPTLLPIEFNDLGRFEAMRPYLEDVVQTMIDQYPFLFCGEDAVVMV